MANKNKKEITLGDLSDQINNLSQKTDDRIESLTGQIENLAEAINFGFNTSEKRFQKIENNLTEVRKILEAHTTILKRLDEERIFTLNYVKRLENEIEKIKVHLKIA